MHAIADEVKAQILDLARQGVGRNRIATMTGVTGSTVTKLAHAAGIAFDRRTTADATAAKKIDYRAKRAKLLEVEHEILERSQKLVLGTLRDGEKNPWQTILKGAYGVEETHSLNFVPARDMRETASSRQLSMQTISRLEASISPEADAVTNLLDALADKLGIEGA